MSWSEKIEFSDIKNPIQDYNSQKSIQKSRLQKLLAATIHYNLDVPTLIRYLGGNYTGEYRKINETIEILKNQIVTSKLYLI